MEIRKLTGNFIFYILAIILLFTIAESKDKLTPYSISFGGGVSGNIHDASFSQIPGFKSCCPEYTGAFGMGYSFHLGFSYKFDSKLFGMPWKYSANISYNNLGAVLKDEEHIGNVISGNTYTKGISEYSLDAGINTFAVDQFISVTPFESIPLGINAGFSIGFLTGKSFEQEEKLISPGGSAFENGSTVRNKLSGEITGASTALIFLRLGMSYEIYRTGNLALSPVINFNYSILNNAESLDWKTHFLFAGLNLEYNIPKAAKDEPKPVPVPALPVPPKPVPITLAMDAFSEGKLLANGATINVKRKLTREMFSYKIQPIVFFSKDKTTPENSSSKTGAEAMQANTLDGIALFIKENPGSGFSFTVYQTDDELPGTADKRAAFLKNALADKGIDTKDIKFSTKQIEVRDLANSQLADEYRIVRLNAGNSNNTIKVFSGGLISGEKFETMPITVVTNIGNADNSTVLKGSANYNESSIELLNPRENIFKPDEAFKLNTTQKQLYIQFVAENKYGEKDIDYHTYYLDFNDVEGDTVFNLVKSGDSKYYEYFLGFFDYNRSDFMSFDREVVAKVKQALADRKKVEFLPLTDNLGSVEHNSKLANSRLNSAYNLIGTKDGITPVFPEGYLFSNDEPSGRILNRSVLVKIYE